MADAAVEIADVNCDREDGEAMMPRNQRSSSLRSAVRMLPSRMR